MQNLNFEDIYQDYWKKIYRLCMGYVNDDDSAKDLCQETFVAVFHQTKTSEEAERKNCCSYQRFGKSGKRF